MKELHIVVVGSSFAAKLMWEHIFETAKSSPVKVRVTVVSPTTHAFFCFASPRYLADGFNFDQAFFPTERALARACQGTPYRFIQGTVEHIDLEKQSVAVKNHEYNIDVLLQYDHLIIASGTKTQSNIYKINTTYEDTERELSAAVEKLKTAKRIASIGGGPTGIEVAAEVKAKYPNTSVTLYAGLASVLHLIGGKLSTRADAQLKALGVNVIPSLKYTSVEELKDGTSKVTFADGSSEIFDLVFISTRETPNSSFIDEEYKNPQGYILTDKHLRLNNHPEVSVVGDVMANSPRTFADVKMFQSAVVYSVLDKQIFKKNIQLSKYTDHAQIIAMSLSKKGGVGQLGGWQLPSFVVKILRETGDFAKKGQKFLA